MSLKYLLVLTIVELTMMVDCTIVFGSNSETTSTQRALLTTAQPFVGVYSSRLSVHSPTFIRPNGASDTYYPYEALQLQIQTRGTYSFRSYSWMDTYGCLYQSSFDPDDPDENLLVCNDDGAGGAQFLITRNLPYTSPYVLVVTTYTESDSGNYSIGAWGRGSVSAISISPVETRYDDSLSSANPKFLRPAGRSGYSYYYSAIEIRANRSGTYTTKSRSSVDTYGCLYDQLFNSSDTSQNLVDCDDDSAGNLQFKLVTSLRFNRTYVLVVTTTYSLIEGSYSIVVTGSSVANMTSITPCSPDTSLSTLAVTLIVLGCLLFCCCATVVCCRLCKSRESSYSNQRSTQLTSHSTRDTTTYGTYVEETPTAFVAVLFKLRT